MIVRNAHTKATFRSPLVEGNAKRRQTGGAFSLVAFFWRSKRKQLAAGQPPAVFDGYRYAQPILRMLWQMLFVLI